MAGAYLEHVKAQKGESAEYQTLKTKINDTKATIEGLKGEIEKAKMADYALVKCPVDKYQGADKAALKKKVIDAYKDFDPKAEILGVYFIDSNWERKAGSEWIGNTLTKYDNSWLTVKVVKKESNEVAIVSESVIKKNHMKGNEVSLLYYFTSPGKFDTRMLVKNVK